MKDLAGSLAPDGGAAATAAVTAAVTLAVVVDAPRLAPFNPTADDAIALAVSLASLRSGDVVVDLGCGDGRVLLAVAEACEGVQCVGFEIDGAVVARANTTLERARAAGGSRAAAAARVRVVHGDACGHEAIAALQFATVAFVYLVPSGLTQVRESLEGILKRGGRVVSNMFSVPGWRAAATLSSRGCNVHLYSTSCGDGGGSVGGGGQGGEDERKRDHGSVACSSAS